VGNTVYLGPGASAARLRTLAALRAEELARLGGSLTKSRRQELQGRRNFAWNDLDAPRSIVQAWAAELMLEARGLDQIPHDLWAGAFLPQATPTEALSIVLIQFDLTWNWTDRGHGIEIVPVPETVALEKTFTPSKSKMADALREWPAKVPGLVVRTEGAKVLVRGTAEQLEELERFLETGKTGRDHQPKPPPPLSQRQFTLRIQDVPAQALLRQLEKSGVIFKYDADALKEAGIDLNRRIKLEVDKAPAPEFFGQIFDQLGLAFEIDNLTVSLRPK
jgi:hypothetical protein